MSYFKYHLQSLEQSGKIRRDWAFPSSPPPGEARDYNCDRMYLCVLNHHERRRLLAALSSKVNPLDPHDVSLHKKLNAMAQSKDEGELIPIYRDEFLVQYSFTKAGNLFVWMADGKVYRHRGVRPSLVKEVFQDGQTFGTFGRYKGLIVDVTPGTRVEHWRTSDERDPGE